METQPITREDFRAQLRISRRAFHFELRDSYGIGPENEPFRRWLSGEPDDYAWRASWLTFVREMTSIGVSIQRARVVTEPPTDCYLPRGGAAQAILHCSGPGVVPRHPIRGVRLLVPFFIEPEG